MINKRALIKACYMGLTFANATIGSIYMIGQLTMDFNIIIGFIYFVISVICIYLAFYNY